MNSQAYPAGVTHEIVEKIKMEAPDMVRNFMEKTL